MTLELLWFSPSAVVAATAGLVLQSGWPQVAPVQELVSGLAALWRISPEALVEVGQSGWML